MMPDGNPAPLTRAQRITVLVVAFCGWMFAGMEISIMPLICRPAIRSFLETPSGSPENALTAPEIETAVGAWLADYISIFLLGAALGGLVFGWLGDRIGRSKGMAYSILCYSIFTGVSYFVRSPMELLILRFVACLGVGGMWPNGVSLVSEAWEDASRPLLAGLIGTAANVGFVLLGVIGYFNDITPDSWRWVMIIGGLPVFLGVFALVAVPESPSWLRRRPEAKERSGPSPVREIWTPPLLKLTILGILLGAIPLVGTSAAANWMVTWSDKVGGAMDPKLKAMTQIARSSGAAFGSLLG
jgi:MFS family permease